MFYTEKGKGIVITPYFDNTTVTLPLVTKQNKKLACISLENLMRFTDPTHSIFVLKEGN